MRTFAWTSLSRIIIILAAWVYMTNFQSDALYNFLTLNNPATNAVNSCIDEIKTVQSGTQAQFDELKLKLDTLLSGSQTSQPATPNIVHSGNVASTGTTVTLTRDQQTGTVLTGATLQLSPRN